MARKKNRNIVLDESQIALLVTSSIRNLVDFEIFPHEEENSFVVALFLFCVLPSEFEEHSIPNIENVDYDTEAFFTSHMIEPLQPISTNIFRMINQQTKEKVWGTEIVIDKTNIADFIQALAEINGHWNFVEDEQEVSQEPSEHAVIVEGNDTIN